MWVSQLNSSDLTLLECTQTIVYFPLRVCLPCAGQCIWITCERSNSLWFYGSNSSRLVCEPLSSFTATYLRPVPLLAESPLIYQTLSADQSVSHEHTGGGEGAEGDSKGVKWDTAKGLSSKSPACVILSSGFISFLSRVTAALFCTVWGCSDLWETGMYCRLRLEGISCWSQETKCHSSVVWFSHLSNLALSKLNGTKNVVILSTSKKEITSSFQRELVVRYFALQSLGLFFYTNQQII